MITLFVVLWAAGFVVAARLRRRPAGADSHDAGDLSVIIPARDEEHNLPRLLGSLRAQETRPLEIIVVDDGSRDRTADIAREHGATVIASAPLPGGWRGKTWACHQGAAAARGGWLMFLDADTWFESGGFAKTLAMRDGGALALVPWHATGGLVEDLSLFFNLCMTAGTVPDGLSGQFLLVRQVDYRACGGHDAVRGEILENFHMAARFHEAGVATRCLPGRGAISFRMYPEGLRSMIPGWSKGFAKGAGRTRPSALLPIVAWMTGLMLPLPAVFLTGEWWWAAAYALGVAQVAWIARRVGAFRPLALLFYPVPLVFFFGLFARAACGGGNRGEWKGRRIDAH